MISRVADEPFSKRELGKFLEGIFHAEDRVEVRLIETWREGGQGRSRFIDRFWLTPQEILSSWPLFQKENLRGANIFYGVNPRSGKGGKKEDVSLCRTLWADLDNARPCDESIWAALPPPSYVIDSGRGVHLYWRLKEPVALTCFDVRSHIEAILKGTYRILSSDSVHDVTRLLRLPGFQNVKDLRNGRTPQSCYVASYHEERCYHISDFNGFKTEIESAATKSSMTLSVPDELRTIHGTRNLRRIRGLVRLLDSNTDDRSKRDFFVVTKLLSLGCTTDEISGLVCEHSKFRGNETYLARTLENAKRRLGW